jgi:hypothetical protein
MTRLSLTLLLASAALAQNKPVELKFSGELKFFLDGAGVALHTESSAARSPLSTSGSVTVGPPAHRIVLDANDTPLFAYDLDLRKLPDGRVSLRINPVDRRTFKTAVPTISASREFPPLNLGDQVQVDIMQNPATGEKLWDVLRIIEDRESYPKSPTGDRFSFERITVTIDGKVVAERPNMWMIGKALRMTIGAHGDYFLVLTPTPDFPFQGSGWVDHNVLRFKAGGEQVVITGKSNLLQHAEYGTVWVYYVPDDSSELRKQLARDSQIYTPNHPEIRRLERLIAAHPGALANFACGDTMDQIYPKDERK